MLYVSIQHLMELLLRTIIKKYALHFIFVVVEYNIIIDILQQGDYVVSN